MNTSPRHPSIDDCVFQVCLHYGLSRGQVMGRERSRHIAQPRQLVYWLAHHCTNHSVLSIGRHMGRDHSTCVCGIRAVEARMKDRDFDLVARTLKHTLITGAAPATTGVSTEH
jgi:chromosomal replication initiator protein